MRQERWSSIIGLLVAACIVFTACATPTPAVVEKVITQEVEKVVTQIVKETVKETVIVEGTPQVIEKEVTKIVEVEKQVEVVVTATPEPSDAPKLGRHLIGELEGPKVIIDPSEFPTEFNEAPELAALVAAGELPPLEERLPVREDLLVFEPLHEIGTYGGVWRRGFTGPGDSYNSYRCCSGTDYILFRDETYSQPLPNIAKGWEWSDDFRSIDLFLRKGMRWSDGQPFTADDILFWYEDLYLNPDIRKSPDSLFVVNGENGKAEKIDDYTVRYSFAAPYPFFLQILSTSGDIAGGQYHKGGNAMGGYAPKHYLSQFHSTYVGEDEANRKAQEAGFENWVQLLKARAKPTSNTELPVLSPWIIKIPNTEPVWVLERNPYYFGVDTAGNQLPYIDRVEMTLAENLEVINLRAIAGEYDLQARHLDIAKLPLFLEYGEQAGYKVYLDPGDYGSDFQLRPNQNYDLDPEIGKWLQNTDFRRALSLGIDRDQINEIFFLGMGVPGSAAPDPANPYYPGDEYRTLWHTYEPDKANAMLDAIGLDKKDPEGFRIRTDNGERLTLQMITLGGQFVPFTQIAEMIQEQWEEIGIDVQVKEVERTLADEMSSAGELHFYVWNNDSSVALFTSQADMVLPTSPTNTMGRHYGLWYVTNGEEGQEPPPRMKEAMEMLREGFTATDEERVRLGKEIWKIAVDEVYQIGTVGLAPGGMALRVASVKMGNVPERMINGPLSKNPAIARPQTFFFKQ